MTNLYKVTDNTTQEYQNFITTTQIASDRIGALTLDVIKSTTMWARLGYSLKEAQQLATQTTVYQNVGDLASAEVASEALIASIKGFGIEVDEQGKNIEHVVDVFNEVGNNFAISSAGIGEAVKRSAASLSSAGNTLEESVAMITAANSTIQEPTRVGNALKTVSMRIRGVSEDGEDLSEIVPKLESNFRSIGLTLKKDENTFKSTYEIFGELAKVWDKLSDMKQAEILELVAGKHQGNVIASMLTNWKDAEGALEAGLNSFGSAARENEKYLESIQGKVNQFKNAVGSFWTQSINSDEIKSFIEFGTSLIRVLSTLTNTFGFFSSATGIATLAILTFNKSIRSNVLQLFNIDLKAVALATKVFTGSTIAARAAVIGLQAAMSVGLSLALVGITSLISHLIQKQQEQKQLQKELEEQNKTITNSWINHKENVEELINKYEELQKSTSNGTIFSDLEQEQEYRDVIEKLSELMPNLVDSIDDKGNKHLKNAEAIKEELKYAQMLAENDQQQRILDAEKNFKGDINNIKEYKKEVTKIQREIDLGGEYVGDNDFIEYSESQLNALNRRLIVAQQQVATYTNIMRDNLNSLTRTILEKNKVELSDTTSKQLDEITKSLDVNALDPKELNAKSYEVANLVTKLNSLSTIQSPEGLKEAKDDIYKLAEASGITKNAIDLLINGFVTASQSASNFFKDSMGYDYNTATNIYNLAEATNTLGEAFETAKDDISPLNQLLVDLDKGQSQSASSMSDLIKKYPELSKHLKRTKDGYTFEKEAVEKLRDSKIQLFNISIKKEKERATDQLNNSIKNLNSYGLELKAINSLADAKERLNEIDNEKKKAENELVLNQIFDSVAFAGMGKYKDQVLETGSVFAQKSKEKVTAIEKENSVFKENISYFEQLEKLAESYLLGANDSTLGTSLEKDKKAAKETTEELSKLQKQINAVDAAINKIQNKYDRYSKSSQKYRDALIEENKLLEQKKNLLKQGQENPLLLLPVKSNSSTADYSDNDSSSIRTMLSNAQSLQGNFTYKQVPGKFKGTYEEFVKGAVSDCSQFVQEMFDEFLDIQLPRTAAEQAKKGVKVKKEDLQAGDLVFFNTTGKDNSHVGVYMGDGKFIQMGNKGLSTQNINSEYWSDKYQGARRVATSASAVPTKQKGYTSKELEEAKNKAEKDEVAADNEQYENRLKILDSFIAEYEIKLAKQDGILKKSQLSQSNYVEGSKKWRDEENKQIDVLMSKRQILHQQAETIRNFLKQKGIESDEYDAALRQLGEAFDELTREVNDKRFSVVISELTEFKDKISDVGYELELSKAIMSQYSEGSTEYTKELQNQINLTKRQVDINKEAIKYLEKQLSSEQLSAASKAGLTKELRELVLANYNYTQSIKELNDTYADDIIDNYKKMIEKQRDLELDAIEDRLDAENKRHDAYMKNLDDEYSKFEEVINAQLKLMDRQNESDDYDSELNKKLTERQKILDEINVLSRDDSIEGKARKKEYEDQLAVKDEEIAKFRLDRERELRKQNLTDQLDDKKKQTDNLKDIEDEHHDSIVDNLEDEKKKTEQKYRDILENEKSFYEMKQKLLSDDKIVVDGVLTELKDKYGMFFEFLKNQAFETSQAFENMNYSFQQDFDKVNNFPSSSSDSSSGSSSNSSNNQQSNSKDTPEARQAWSTYLNNKKQAEDIRKQMEGLKKESSQYKNLDNQFSNLKSQNDSLRSRYPFFPDKNYSSLVNFNPFTAETGGLTPAWGGGGKFLLAHEKELVLNKMDTANILSVVDMTRGLVNKLKSLATSFTPPPAVAGAGVSTGESWNIRIDKLVADESGVDTFFRRIQSEKKKRGY
ncbi:Murein DD-endopeptidase MepS/Murein LD-carboxypeptidase precursor [compost metagenome]